MESELPELKIALNAAVKAGREIMKVYSRDFSMKTKKDDSPITTADLKSNKIMLVYFRKENSYAKEKASNTTVAAADCSFFRPR